MNYKRILTIQDISCVGQCSLTVALPILSACGLETAVLPSAVLSTHTAWRTGYTFRDLTEDMPAIEKHWNAVDIDFDAFYTGYLGSSKQIDYVKSIMTSTAKKDSVKIIDPAMADNGSLYPGFDADFVDAMRELCKDADYLLPNITEACLLTNTEYIAPGEQGYDEAYIMKLVTKLYGLCGGIIVLTGVGYKADETGAAVYDGANLSYYTHTKLSQGSHGTGDVFASAFTGALLHGKTAIEAAGIAADYVVECIKCTMEEENHWYGVCFEPAIPYLIKRVYE